MVHQIHIRKIKRLDHSAEIGSQSAHAIAIVECAQFAVAARVERDHPPTMPEAVQLMLIPHTG
mgnify:CR=1 FL=1